MRVAALRQDPGVDRTVLEGLRADGVEARAFARIDHLLALDQAELDLVEVLFAPGYVEITGDVLARMPRLHGLISPYIGIEGFDRPAATARGVLIANGQMAESVESMAEATVLMLLAAAYRLPATLAAMAEGAWPAPLARGRLLSAMTIGVIGFGQIAQAVVQRLIPFGCRLVVHAPRLRAPLPTGVAALDLDALVAQSDAIILLASLGADSRHMLDADRIARIKPGAIVVNTARGGLIDEAALVAAARWGKLGWLALDVFDQEPLPADAPIRALPQTILTPHAVGLTGDTFARLPLHALENIRAVLEGRVPNALVNPEALPEWRKRLPGISAAIDTRVR